MIAEQSSSRPAPWRAASWRVWWRHSTARLVTAAALLGAACLIWAATPPGSAGPAAPAIIVLAACALAGSAARLALAGVQRPDTAGYPGPLTRLGVWSLDALRRVPWAEGALLGVLALEALHPARPWHTALLGVALTGYLFAVHLGRVGQRPRRARGHPAQPGPGAGRGPGAARAGRGLGAAAGRRDRPGGRRAARRGGHRRAARLCAGRAGLHRPEPV